MIEAWIPVAALFIVAMVSLFIMFVHTAYYVQLADKYANLKAEYRWAAHLIAVWNKDNEHEED